MDLKTLKVEQTGSVMTVTLHRPHKLNAVNDTMLDELTGLFTDLRRDTTTRFVILTGSGADFSSGADLVSGARAAAQTSRPPYEIARIGQMRGHDLMRSLEALEQVTIAAINGRCLGAGFATVLGCDFRIAAEEAQLSLPEARIGMFFTWGCTPRLVRLIGPSRAKEVIMTCDSVDAKQAQMWGLVNRVVPQQDLLESARALAHRIGQQEPLAVRLTKKIVDAASLRSLGDLSLCEPELVERVFLSDDVPEGISAFLEKREPKFGKG